jgi:hypothetical protein
MNQTIVLSREFGVGRPAYWLAWALFPNCAPVGLPDGNAKRNSYCEAAIAVKLSLLPHEVAGGEPVVVTFS